MRRPRPRFSIIVPNYQGKAVFPACVRSLLRQDVRDLQVVFVDDSSTDGSLELAKRLFGKDPRFIAVRTAHNSGFTGACNRGLQECRGKYVLFVNNDGTFASSWLREMHRGVAGKRNVLGASLVSDPRNMASMRAALRRGLFGSFTVTGFGYRNRRLTPQEKRSGLIELHTAGILILPRAALGDELFVPEYFAYGEDVELCWRLRLRGYRVVLNLRARMDHVGGHTRKTVPSFNRRATLSGTRNRIRNTLVFYEWANVLRVLPPYLLMEAALFLSQPKAMGLRLRSYFWVLLHPRTIWHHRRRVQRSRTVPDREILGMLSCVLQDPDLVRPGWRRSCVDFANALMRGYCKLVRLYAFDRDDPDAIPAVDVRAVTVVGTKKKR